jgi:phage FluMu protein Com
MNATIRVECPNCRHWNELEVEKAFLNPNNPEPKVTVLIPSYIPHKVQKCTNCGTVLAEPDELFRIVNGEAVRYRMKDAGV